MYFPVAALEDLGLHKLDFPMWRRSYEPMLYFTLIVKIYFLFCCHETKYSSILRTTVEHQPESLHEDRAGRRVIVDCSGCLRLSNSCVTVAGTTVSPSSIGRLPF